MNLFARSSRCPVTLGIVAAFVAGSLAVPAAAQQPEPVKFVRYSHIANDGSIAFTYQDDIWLAGPGGANPHRLTAHVARDFSPRFSPDGRSIAFTSNRHGNNDVFIVPAAGGEPRQLTFYSGDDQVAYWTPDGKGVVISTNRGAYAWGSPLHVQPLDGSIATPLAMDVGRTGMFNADQSLLAFNRAVPTYWRKHQRGNATGDVSVLNVKTGDVKDLTDTDLKQYKTAVNDIHPMWGADGMIYFASERDGHFNIWRIAATGGAPTQVTTHKDDGVQFPSISPDGKRIIYENNFELWTLDVPGGQPKRVPIAMSFDPKESDISIVAAANRAEGFTVSPTGDYIAVDMHGEIAIVPTEAGVGERMPMTASPWRERGQLYSPDGKKITYISDESGEEEIWLFDVAAGTRKKLTTHQSVKADLTWAPSSNKLAFTGANRLFEVDVAGGPAREVGYNPGGGYSISQYGPDENWIVYMRRDADQNADVFMYDLRAKREYLVASGPFNEAGGMVTPDGKTLVFSSNRVGATNQLFAVSLSRVSEDPNDPLVRERERRRREEAGGGRGQGAGGAAPSGPITITIDTNGIARRAVQLTRGTGSIGGAFLSRDGRTIYFAVGGGGGGGGGGRRGGGAGAADSTQNGLFAMSIDGRDRRRIAAGTYAGMQPTADRRSVFFRGVARPAGEGEDQPPQGGRGGGGGGFEVHRLTLPAGGAGGGAGAAGGGGGAGAAGGGTQRGERINFSFNVKVDRRAEWEQIFEEAYRVMKYRFYDEKMHGFDWAAIRTRYKPLVKHVGTNEDLYDLANEMIGELNASHTGVSGPATRSMPRLYDTRYLGFEMEPAGARYKISHIYRDGPADKEWLGLAEGDFVLALNGQDLKAGADYWKTLSAIENDYVGVRVSKTAGGENAREVRIASVTNLQDVKYEEWIAINREIVERETNGQIAYIHIRAMNQPSLERFQDDIDEFWNKKGVIVDVRFNGGGNIDQELLEILSRKPYEFWNNRNSLPHWGRRPRQAIVGPKVMMTNHRSGSDAEVTPQGFRDLGLGRIVGTPTAAAVIATGSYQLLNGGSIRTPGSLVVTYDPTKPNNHGINLENFGVAPDVFIENTPMDILKGTDRELKAAIEEVLKMLRDGNRGPVTSGGSQQ